MEELHRDLKELKHLHLPIAPIKNEDRFQLLLFLRGKLSVDKLRESAEKFGYEAYWHRTIPNMVFFRRASQPKESEVELLAKAHGFRFKGTYDKRYFHLEPREIRKPTWGVVLWRKKGRINSVRVITNEKAFTAGRRQRILRFLTELAPKAN